MRLFLALLTLLLPATAPARTIEARPALWKLADADTTIWLFGTVHVLSPEIDWFRGRIAKAFRTSGTLVVETELGGNQMNRTIMAHAIDTDDVPLRDELDPGTRAAFDAQMTANGMPPASFDKFKPWFAATSLTAIAYGKLGFSPASGVEMRLYREARLAAKPVVPLESLEEQISLLDGFARPVQLKMLSTTLDELADGRDHLTALITAWRTGDEGALARQMNEGLDDVPELRTALLDRRNDRFAAWIADRMRQPGVAFVAIGAGHFDGARNVRELLAARGFRIQRVQ